MRITCLLLLTALAACRGASDQPVQPKSERSAIPSAEPRRSASSIVSGARAPAEQRVFRFDTDSPEAAPAGFVFGRTGAGARGRWVVRSQSDSPSGGNVLAQLDADATSFRFPVAVAAEPRVRDVRVTVRCKLVSGRVDQACGLVARYGDENNYLVTRANALENNIRLYTLKAGRREQIASADTQVTAGTWHEYRFEALGDQLRVFWDGKSVVEHRDSTFMAAGSAGVWTKADSVTYFDDLTIEAL